MNDINGNKNISNTRITVIVIFILTVLTLSFLSIIYLANKKLFRNNPKLKEKNELIFFKSKEMYQFSNFFNIETKYLFLAYGMLNKKNFYFVLKKYNCGVLFFPDKVEKVEKSTAEYFINNKNFKEILSSYENINFLKITIFKDNLEYELFFLNSITCEDCAKKTEKFFILKDIFKESNGNKKLFFMPIVE